MHTKFRLSDHTLAMEEGRRKRPFVPREQRMCPLCSLEVENEIPILVYCNKYDFTREPFYQKLADVFPEFISLDELGKFVYLMSQEDDKITEQIVTLIYNMLEMREQLLHGQQA